MSFFVLNQGIAQKQKPSPDLKNIDKKANTTGNLESIQLERRIDTPNPATSEKIDYSNFSNITLQKSERSNLVSSKKVDQQTQLPYHVKGLLTKNKVDLNASPEEKAVAYLNELKDDMQIKEPVQEFVFKSQKTDQVGAQHLRFSQVFNNIKVHGSEVVLHQKEGQTYLFNGRYYPTPKLENLTPTLSAAAAQNSAIADVNTFMEFKSLSDMEKQLLPHEQIVSELVIYHVDKNIDAEALAYHITLFPNLINRYEYFIDAQSGAVLHKYLNTCKLFHNHGSESCSVNAKINVPEIKTVEENASFLPPPGPETAQAVDLKGITRTINVYETGGTFYMIDASRAMFNSSLSQFPANPAGVIWTLDAFDTYPQNSDFNYDQITSSNNSWNNANGVSAHYNGGLAYNYFKNTFGRESINGAGGNIISLINVSDEDGSDFDNAFWNGAAMFYGSGDVAFNAPLAKASDVAGHEMSHGVIQNTANLEYQGESGALNESFADIFGAMIDRDDWKIGEEVASSSIFPTGTMRDMENPNNGGNSSNFYWQPENTNEQYTGSQDNGGVHINSGIPNHAYYKFATAIGKDKAEQIFYSALTDYLVSSSRFVDLRAAVEEAAGNLYGNAEVTAAQTAFAAVGIGGGGSIENTQEDVEVNTGTEFILWSNPNLQDILVNNTDGSTNGTISNNNHISKPSISDDGTIVLYIGEDKKMYEIDIDWATGDILNEYVLEETETWRNVATSKDGTKLAGLTGSISDGTYTNEIWVFDFVSNSAQTFTLFNPTFTEGVTTGDVLLADVIEFDHSGEYILYDAFNSLSSNFGDDITYWDIGLLKVWDNDSNGFTDGSDIQKLFNGLPENVSVGNPTFSKNSPYIIAFDYIETDFFGTDNKVQGVNTQTGDQGVIWENTVLGYPSYSTDDDRMIFSAENTNDQPVIGLRSLKADKITGDGDASAVISNADWATWFATGERNLQVDIDELPENLNDLQVFPNPFRTSIRIQMDLNEATKGSISIKNILGQEIENRSVDFSQGRNRFEFDSNDWSNGTYFLECRFGDQSVSRKVVKLK